MPYKSNPSTLNFFLLPANKLAFIGMILSIASLAEVTVIFVEFPLVSPTESCTCPTPTCFAVIWNETTLALGPGSMPSESVIALPTIFHNAFSRGILTLLPAESRPMT